jgi:hypothetical protein
MRRVFFNATKIQHGLTFKLISSRSTTNIQDVEINFSSGRKLPVLSMGSNFSPLKAGPGQKVGLCTSATLLRRFKLAAALGISPNPLSQSRSEFQRNWHSPRSVFHHEGGSVSEEHRT